MTPALQLFGAPTVTFGGTTSALPFERRGQLLAYLGLKRSWVGRAEIAALLWPDQDGRLASTNLRKALFRLQSLPWAAPLDVQGAALRFAVDTDVAAFESVLGERRFAEALHLRRGELLAGFEDPGNAAWTSWLAFERDRLRTAWRGAAQQLLAGGIGAAEGAALAARLLDEDPYDEEALRAYVSCLARNGQAALARQAYRDFVARLQKELGLAPGAELRALHDALGSAAAPPAIAEVVADDGFVGRTVELRRIGSLLGQDDCRLLSIFGPGGVGKTRLARRVARECAAAFADGATFVPLDDVTSANELGGRLAHELGIALKGRSDPLDQVIEALRPRHALLVLDNFEHLVGAAPLLERLLAACPRLKCVVTSRFRLALAAEWLLPLDGLPCPEDEDRDRVEAFDAARLFVRAARRVQPDFAPAAEAAAIVDICRQVAGLPLALELAAAWTRVLSCAAIAEELRQGTALLRADAAGASRHAGIEVVFDQSWRLLTDVERDVLARLSVFHGSFSPEAARAATRAPLPVLAALADKSLLHKDGARLRLHPLVQQLSAQRLGDGAACAETRSAHAAYFHFMLARWKDASEDGDRKALEAIDAEFENCRQAWRHAIAGAHAVALARSVQTLLNYCEHRARFAEGLELFREAAESPLAEGDDALRALMLGEHALLEFRLGRYAEAEDGARRALEAMPSAGTHEAKYRALSVLAGCATFTGRLDDAQRLYRQALAIAQANGQPHDIARTLDNLSLVEKHKGNYDEALRLAVEALAQHRRIGNHAATALCLSNLGSFHLFLNRNEAAAACLHEALALSERHGLVSTRGYVLANLVELALKSKDVGAARAHAERALEIADGTGMRSLAGWLKLQLARLAAGRGDLAAAGVLLSAGAEVSLALGAPSLKAAALLAFAELLEARGQAAEARQVLAFAKEEPSIGAPDREELRAEWARRGAADGPRAEFPGLPLDELLRRIVVEGDLSYRPLLAALGAI